MTKRRPLTDEQKAEGLRLKAIYEERKAAAQAAGRKLTQADVAEDCGWKGQSAVAQYMGRIPLNIEALLKLSTALRFSPEEVSPRLASMIGGVAAAASNQNTQEAPTAYEAGEVSVPMLQEIEVAPGKTVVRESGEFKSISLRTMRRKGVLPENAVCLTVSGNSMDKQFPDGTTVSADRGARRIVDGEVYALSHAGQLRVKQLYRLPGGIRMRSYNRAEYEDEDYSAEEIEQHDISVIGRVWWAEVLL
jgi:phage repressor protein C with HTH and peptisase S24 domain